LINYLIEQRFRDEDMMHPLKPVGE